MNISRLLRIFTTWRTLCLDHSHLAFVHNQSHGHWKLCKGMSLVMSWNDETVKRRTPHEETGIGLPRQTRCSNCKTTLFYIATDPSLRSSTCPKSQALFSPPYHPSATIAQSYDSTWFAAPGPEETGVLGPTTSGQVPPNFLAHHVSPPPTPSSIIWVNNSILSQTALACRGPSDGSHGPTSSHRAARTPHHLPIQDSEHWSACGEHLPLAQQLPTTVPTVLPREFHSPQVTQF